MAYFYWNFTLFLVFLSKVSGVISALYPTQPIANTVFYCGDYALITWTDNSRRPHVDGLGPLAIKLYTNEDDYVATLAEGVNPVSFSTLVTIPLDLRNDTLYLLRFSGPGLYEDVWTADFTILPDASHLRSNSGLSSSLSASPSGPGPSGNLTTPGIMGKMPATTPTSTAQATNTDHMSPISSVTTDSFDDSGFTYTRKNGGLYSRADQLESARFRLLFIVWPAMFGLSMAL